VGLPIILPSSFASSSREQAIQEYILSRHKPAGNSFSTKRVASSQAIVTERLTSLASSIVGQTPENVAKLRLCQMPHLYSSPRNRILEWAICGLEGPASPILQLHLKLVLWQNLGHLPFYPAHRSVHNPYQGTQGMNCGCHPVLVTVTTSPRFSTVNEPKR
jgi:hypothetical protein